MKMHPKINLVIMKRNWLFEKGTKYREHGNRSTVNAQTNSLWSRISKNPDRSTGPLPCPFAFSLAPLTCLLAPHCLLRTAHFARKLRCAHSLRGSWDSDWLDYFFSVFFLCSGPQCSRPLPALDCLLLMPALDVFMTERDLPILTARRCCIFWTASGYGAMISLKRTLDRLEWGREGRW